MSSPLFFGGIEAYKLIRQFIKYEFNFEIEVRKLAHDDKPNPVVEVIRQLVDEDSAFAKF